MKMLILSASLFLASMAAAAEPAIWQLDRVAEVGGHRAEILGAPRVVAEDGIPAIYFDGVSDGLFVPVNPLADAGQFTIEVLFKPAADGAVEQRFLHVQDQIGAPDDPGRRALLEIRLADGTWALDGFLLDKATQARLTLLDPAKRHPADRWTWVALVYGAGRMAIYVNGKLELEGPINFPPMGPGRVSLGVRQNKVYWFKGGIREVRWHRSALKAEALQKP